MKDKIQDLYKYLCSIKSVILIILLCIVVLVLSAKGITDESVVDMNGDMPNYLMNGAFFYDLVRDLSITDPLGYAYRYYARYPALSLGHHPLLLGVAEVPFYAIFGISVFSARLTIILFMLLAAIFWFLLISSVYDETVAFLSSLLFVTTPYIVKFSRIVMSEIPTLALLIIATYFFYKYCELDKKKYALASAISWTLSVYAKHIAVFMFPVFFIYLLIKKGIRSIIRKELIISYIIIIVLVLPLVFISLKFAQTHVAMVTEKTLSDRLSLSYFSHLIEILWKYHLTPPVLVLSLISIFVSLYRKDNRIILFLFWTLGCYMLVIYLALLRPRDTIYLIPVFSLFASTTVNLSIHRTWKVFISTLLLVIIGYQFAIAFRLDPVYADGYEQAARYVTENKKGDSVLYSGVNDTGYFIFFIRKHDTNRDLIVLRANKILATSKMHSVVDDRITNREEIYEILNNFGVGYVVIEDTESGSRALEWLREEVKSSRFILRKKIILQSNRRKVNNIPLSIYEYKEYKPLQETETLHMNIPLMGDSINVNLKDILKKNKE